MVFETSTGRRGGFFKRLYRAHLSLSSARYKHSIRSIIITQRFGSASFRLATNRRPLFGSNFFDDPVDTPIPSSVCCARFQETFPAAFSDNPTERNGQLPS